jgi:phenylacetate-coenzyme A ligase PaaK-like adenylate-forming protein
VATYEERRQRHVERLLGLLPEHLDRLTWSRERLGAWRTAALQQIVAFAREHSQWHRDRLSTVDVGAIGADQMSGLPVMTKHDLLSAFDDIVTDKRLTLEVVNSHLSSLASDAYLFDEYHAVGSGGSSGVRGICVWGWDACITPRRVVAAAEPLLPEVRAAVSEVWGVNVVNLWGISETGVTAVGCFQADSMHLCDDLVIVEAVDAAGEDRIHGIDCEVCRRGDDGHSGGATPVAP